MNMKFKYTIGCLLASAALASCSDYLNESSGDLLIPEKVDEYQSVLYGEGYPNSFTDDISWIDLMTDDVAISPSAHPESYNTDGDDTNSIPAGQGAFCWAYDIEYYLTGYASPYENRYKNIMACNTVIEAAETMTGNPAKIHACLAQAHTLRAFSYLCLVNWYGLPYNSATADKDMGVVIRLKSEVVRDEPTRSTVAQVYKQINDDLDKALEYFETAESSKSLFIVSKKVALLLKSRVALYTEQWDDAITYGGLIEKEGFNLYNISGKSKEELDNNKNGYVFLTAQNPEIIFTFSDEGGMSYHPFMEYAARLKGASFVPSQTNEGDLINSYEEGDNRIYAFFMQDIIDYDVDWEMYWDYTDYRKIPFKRYGYKSTIQCYSQAFRTVEVLLNMAEAYVQRNGAGDQDKAIALLNELRENRIAAGNYVALTSADFASQAVLLQFVRDERRRELCFEETHRWNDLRRYGCPRIEHQFYATSESVPVTYVLEAGDKNYTLALPKSETEYNTQIELYERRVIEGE